VHAEIFDVDVAAKAGVEEQIPARMMVVVVDVNLIVVPLPIAATVKIVGSHDPVGVVIQKDVASAVIKAARNEDFSHMGVAAMGIRAAWADAFVLRIPIPVMGIVWIIPTLVFAVIVILAIAVVTALFVPALMLAIIVPLIAVTVVVAILRRRGQSQRGCQCRENNSRKEFAHECSLLNRKAEPDSVTGLSRGSPDRRIAGGFERLCYV